MKTNPPPRVTCPHAGRPTAGARWALAGLLGLLGLATLGGCGGGGGADQPTVTTLSASPVMYGRTLFVSVSGQALDKGISLGIASGCGDITQSAGGSDATQQFSCRVNAIGPMTVQVLRGGGTRVASLQLNVPLPQARLTTSKGVIEVELDPIKAPLSVNNFLDYLNEGYYRNTIFHRVVKISDAVIQAGGFSTAANNGIVPKTATHNPIALESQNGLTNLRGSIGLAREGGKPDSATSQFFFNVTDNPAFNYVSADQPGFAVFGRITVGLDVMDVIGAVPTDFRSVVINGTSTLLPNVPLDNIIISAASQIK